ncbi:uncharacterized protein METZ01_LOCUS262763 [marine metagenome]|uniref:Uncharacterized protein n=1 Tax=marine metagenome TaxID=408172 RepID=A0A382JE28_9ZZZZ
MRPAPCAAFEPAPGQAAPTGDGDEMPCRVGPGIHGRAATGRVRVDALEVMPSRMSMHGNVRAA